jgi:PAS domain S-box-containing protein
MHPDSAIGLAAGGLALLGIVRRSQRFRFIGCAIMASVVAASLLEYLSNFHSNEFVGGMSLASALCFLVLATSFGLAQLSPVPKKPWILGVAGLFAAAMAAACGIAILWGSGDAFGLGDWARMSVFTAVGFLLLGIGTVALALEMSLAGLREPLWAPIGATFFLATVRLELLQAFSPKNPAGYSTLAFLGALVGAAVFGAFVHLALKAHLQGRHLGTANLRLEEEMLERRSAERSIQAANDQLEQRIEERTGALEEANRELRQEIARRERVEEDLRKQKEILQMIVDHVPLILKFVDKDGRTQMVNREWERVIGRTLDEITNQGVNVYEEGYPDPVERERILEFVANSNAEWADFKTRVKDGRVIDTSWAVVRLSDGATICIGQDISARKEAERELRHQKEILQTIFDHIPMMISFVDQDHRLQLVNREWERTLGWKFEDIRGQDADVIVKENYPDPEALEQARHFIDNSEAEWVDFKTLVRGNRLIDTSWAILHLSDGTSIGIGQDISARKQAERELRKQKEILQTIFDYIPVMINFVDENHQLKLVNREWEEKLGWTLEEVNSQNLHVLELNYPDPEYRAKVLDFVLHSHAEWADFKTTVRDGRVIDTSWAMLNLSDGTGIGIGQDISKRKRAEEALRESEERFRQLAENIHDLFWIKTPDFKRVLYLSPAYESVVGRPPQTRYQDQDYQPFLDIIHPEDREKMEQIIRREAQDQFDVEFRIIRPDGAVRWIRDRGFPIRDQNGKVYRIAGIAHDITERRLAEEALRDSEERFRQLAENIHEVFWLRSPDFKKLLYVSPMYEKICGRTCESLYAAGPNPVGIHPEDSAWFNEMLKNIAGREFEIEYRIVTTAGDVRWMRDRGFPIRNQSGEIYRMGGVAEDITDRKEAEQRLKASSERLRALSASLQDAREQEATRIAHQIHDDMGGILTGLRWELEALEKMIRVPADEAHLQAMQDKLTTMVGLTDTTINVVRRIASELRPSILDDLGLVEAIEWQTQQFQARTGIECHCHCTLQSDDVGDQQSTAVFRIVQEALTNILRHAQATRVGVAMSEEHGALVLTVTDNGRGITEAEKHSRQALGLLGMQERAHLIGGRVDIVGAPATGTTLHVRVPLARAQMGAAI